MTAVGAVPAETYAARKIAACLDLFIDPDIKTIADDSGLTEPEVARLVAKLHEKRQQSALAKANKAAAAVGAKPEPKRDAKPRRPLTSVVQQDSYILPADWLEHRNEQVRGLARKARAAIEDVAKAVADDVAKEHLWQRREALLAELETLSGELGVDVIDRRACPECGKLLHKQGMGPHRAAHRKEGEAK